MSKRCPEMVVRDGKPTAVILDIGTYQAMLERLEAQDDLKVLAAMKKRPLRFRRFEEFLGEYSPGV